MASTFTQTATKTFARLALLKAQVRIALRRTTNITPSILEKTFDQGLEHKWISKITIYAVDSDKCCRAQLILDIDWDEYDFQLAQGKATVAIDQRWQDDTAIELDEIIKLFNEYVAEYSLNTKYQVTRRAGFSKEMVQEALGLCDAEPIKWKQRNGYSTKIPELSELRIGFYVADG